MSTKKSIVVVDVRILDTFEGAKFVKDLEDTGNVSFLFVLEKPAKTSGKNSNSETHQDGDELLANGAVIRNTGNLNSADFWESVFEFVDNGLTEIVAVAAHYNHWQLINQADKHRVPFKYVYNVDNKRMVWL